MPQHTHNLLLEALLAVLLLAGALYNYIINAIVTPLDGVFDGMALLYLADVAAGGRLAAHFDAPRLGSAQAGVRWLLLGLGLVLGALVAAVVLLRVR